MVEFVACSRITKLCNYTWILERPLFSANSNPAGLLSQKSPWCYRPGKLGAHKTSYCLQNKKGKQKKKKKKKKRKKEKKKKRKKRRKTKQKPTKQTTTTKQQEQKTKQKQKTNKQTNKQTNKKNNKLNKTTTRRYNAMQQLQCKVTKAQGLYYG